MNQTKSKILKATRKAYGDGWEIPKTREEALSREPGDTLAKFIFLELDEALDDDTDPETMRNAAIGLLEVAQNDIESVISAISKAKL